MSIGKDIKAFRRKNPVRFWVSIGFILLLLFVLTFGFEFVERLVDKVLPSDAVANKEKTVEDNFDTQNSSFTASSDTSIIINPVLAKDTTATLAPQPADTAKLSAPAAVKPTEVITMAQPAPAAEQPKKKSAAAIDPSVASVTTAQAAPQQQQPASNLQRRRMSPGLSALLKSFFKKQDDITVQVIANDNEASDFAGEVAKTLTQNGYTSRVTTTSFSVDVPSINIDTVHKIIRIGQNK